MPGDTPSPDNLISALSSRSVSLCFASILIELGFDQLGERRDRRFGLAPGCGQFDRRSRRRRQHHQPHDRAAGHLGSVLLDPNLGVELPGGLDKTGGGAGMQSTLIADRRDPTGGRGGGSVLAHRRASDKSCEATLMYLRPASCAPRTVRSKVSLCRRLASLISIGRLIPAMTSTFGRSMTEIARLEGVPPNMSVSKTAPSPLSTSSIERRMS